MDIVLLSRMVKELILDEEEVSLPGIGSFVAETMPAAFSDKGFTINPPYRRLSFRQTESGSNRLAEFYARNNNLDIAGAERILGDFLNGMRQELQTKKSIIFPGLGKLRATRENYFFFVCDEELDIYPEGFGLDPVSLKTHEATQDEVKEAIAGLVPLIAPESHDSEDEIPDAEEERRTEAEVLCVKEEVASASENEASEQEETAVSENEGIRREETATSENEGTGQEEAEAMEAVEKTESQESLPEREGMTDTEDEPDIEEAPENIHDAVCEEEAEARSQEGLPVAEETAEAELRTGLSGWRMAAVTVIGLIAAAGLFVLAFVVLAHLTPDFIDTILYSQEELEILNTPVN